MLQFAGSALAGCGEIVPPRAWRRRARSWRARSAFRLYVGLGDGSGLELVRELSALSSALIPVVIFSAHDSKTPLLPQVKVVMTRIENLPRPGGSDCSRAA